MGGVWQSQPKKTRTCGVSRGHCFTTGCTAHLLPIFRHLSFDITFDRLGVVDFPSRDVAGLDRFVTNESLLRHGWVLCRGSREHESYIAESPGVVTQ